MLPGSCLSWGLYKRYISLGLIGPSTSSPGPRVKAGVTWNKPVMTAAQAQGRAGSGSGASGERMAM